jgi:hypothetical protein
MKSGTLVALAALVISGSSLAASVDASEINSVIKNLDLTTFPNSVGPRRLPGKTTFADYGFVHVEKTATGANLVRDDKGWAMSFRIISTGPKSLRLCFYDKGLGRPGEAGVSSYNSTSALLVSKSRRGMWTAKQVPTGFAGCRNDPAET